MRLAGTIEIMRRHLTRLARVLFVAVPSFAAGAILMAYLAGNASRLFFQALRLDYSSQEEIAGACARHHGNVHEATQHYANVVSTYDDETWWRKNPNKDGWSIAYPLAAILMRHMWPPEVIEGRVSISEAIDRVRLANSLIEESQMAPAATELDRAAALLGPNGQAKVDALRKNLPLVDDRPLLTFCRTSSAD